MFVNQVEIDAGIMHPEEDPQRVEDTEIQRRAQVLDDFMNSLSPYEKDGFLFKLTKDLPLLRKSLVIQVLRAKGPRYLDA